jgi:tRNA pseudouridine38-40 synthase
MPDTPSDTISDPLGIENVQYEKIGNQEQNSLDWDTSVRVALLLEYCGTAFQGNQFQPDQPTVQGALQDALRHLNLPASPVSFSGRTDAGVHALGQVAHADVSPAALRNVPDLVKALNALLPDSVSIRAAYPEAGRQFNSRRDAFCRWYRYRIYNAPHRSVWAERTAAAHYPTRLDASRMHQAAQMLLGSHDFQSFKGSDTDVTENQCRVRYAQVCRDGDFIGFDIVADRFLYKMVRNISGQLIRIGNAQDPQPPATILEILAARDRRCAAVTARPEGLTLMSVLYPPPFDFFAQDSYVRQLKTMLNPTKMEPFPHEEDLFRKAS